MDRLVSPRSLHTPLVRLHMEYSSLRISLTARTRQAAKLPRHCATRDNQCFNACDVRRLFGDWGIVPWKLEIVEYDTVRGVMARLIDAEKGKEGGRAEKERRSSEGVRGKMSSKLNQSIHVYVYVCASSSWRS